MTEASQSWNKQI